MIAAPELDEYLEEIRDQVCSRCIEKPEGGPPCAPLGKDCGVEMHLPQLIESIRRVHSPLLASYRDHNRSEICAHCALLHTSICPCPMDYLGALLVQAVETVDERHRQCGSVSSEPSMACGHAAAGTAETVSSPESPSVICHDVVFRSAKGCAVAEQKANGLLQGHAR
jgi:hypothetical protein